jgi:uncharacterized protein YjbI with pentapeptide repeats
VSHCLTHATDDELAALAASWRDGEVVCAREAMIGGEDLRRLIDALASVQLEVTTGEIARLRPRSCGTLEFHQATFMGNADFSELSFPGPVYFDHATFEHDANFKDTTFGQHADFDSVTFCGAANFRQAVFDDHAGFESASFAGETGFQGAKFRSYVDLQHAHFHLDAAVSGATFQLARQLGRFTVDGTLHLDDTVFSERVTIEVAASAVKARGTVFTDGARLSVAGAAVDLERADLGRASTLTRLTPEEEEPMLVTLCGAQVSGLSISGVNLERCRFFGAHGLESVNIEQSCKWLRPPAHPGCIDREMIVEEFQWRARREAARPTKQDQRARAQIRWVEHASERSLELGTDLLDPGQIADIYRALRKAREESKDQAGAGDLYYGEMEMRRHQPIAWGRGSWRACFDRVVITAYWLVAGYGLKALRSVIALVLLMAVAAVPLALWGFHAHGEDYFRSAIFAAQSSLTLVHPPEAALSASGEAVQIFVRLAGPALVGLAILAVRSRIKR